ncbi:APC family permease [Arsenicibacter rosenii]|uniref:Amino acid permease n=1 Tax=Arsenicibacter rosenii TaxID=1750698 RepID=A0A1S2VQ94_9BACT|nr:amino acid permease [Arsenicibacter rosenii]OIN60941.1 amino acid permease [Arsenicibacter rosenii]
MANLERSIGLRPAILLVVSVIVGSGVFKKVAPMAAELQSPLLILACWTGAGLISLAGALSNSEMAGVFSDSGGEYIYYQKIYGRFFAFMYGWGNFMVMKTAAIAALAHIFGQSVVSLPGVGTGIGVQVLATVLILLLTWVNYRGVPFAEGLSRLLTYLMFLSVGVIIVLGLQSASGSVSHMTQVSSSGKADTLHGFGLLSALTAASLGAFWGYEGWNHIGYLGEEVKNPQRTLPLALGVGTGLVILLYTLLNAVYIYVLPVDALIQLNSRPDKIAAVEVIREAAGRGGALFVSCLILVTTFNATNASILMSARIFFAMARDRLFFPDAAHIHPVYRTPSMALLLQGGWSILLVWSGSFDQLTDLLIFVSFLFYGATSLGVIILRYKQPALYRPYRVPGYPVIPAFFTFFCAVLVGMTVLSQPADALTGAGLLATGIPFYLYFGRQTHPEKAADR